MASSSVRSPAPWRQFAVDVAARVLHRAGPLDPLPHLVRRSPLRVRSHLFVRDRGTSKASSIGNTIKRDCGPPLDRLPEVQFH